ncbi:hypothetical protein AG1IA_10035 [Rhizoctonia solani AG-1 IA]|uniref:Uncharacterized protein n=1 Tax=Thanatephorus cucumeris (strain AG1-IA) TaxID=983506 RepID=L8WDA1_THACA|nr:hypothetical protein AG1IA_10035 [Rhizoctonia solani AG-1 IA]
MQRVTFIWTCIKINKRASPWSTLAASQPRGFPNPHRSGSRGRQGPAGRG